MDYLDVNYRGASEAIVSTMQGLINFVDLGSGSSAIDGKTLKALGITSRARYKRRANIPTFVEQGLPGYSVDSTTLFLAPAETPPAIMQILNSTFDKVT